MTPTGVAKAAAITTLPKAFSYLNYSVGMGRTRPLLTWAEGSLLTSRREWQALASPVHRLDRPHD